MAATNIPIIVQGNSFNLAIPLQIYVIQGNEMVLQDYTPLPTDDVSIQLKGCRRNYTYTPTVEGNVAKVYLTGNELADNYAIVVSIVKANGERLRSFRTDQFFIVESSDDLTQADIIEGLEDNVIYLQPQYFIAGEDGRGIISVTKTATSGLVDTYTITYTDNTTSTFQVTNGALQPVIVDIEGDVTNAPDEEDLTSVNNGNHDVLKFNDKAYMPTIASGMGRKYLRKNFVNGINKLTQAMVADANTIYHIQYDYDLDGGTITIPAGVTLKFEGGSLANGTIVGQNTIIKNSPEYIFKNVTLSGTWKNITLYPENFGVVAGVDDDFVDEFQRLADNTPNGAKVEFGFGKTYYFKYRQDSEVRTNPTRMVFFDKKNLTINGNGCTVMFIGYDIETLNSQQDPGNGSGRDIFTFIQLLNCEDCKVSNFVGIGDFEPFSGQLIFTADGCNPRAKFIGVMGSSNIYIEQINATNIIGNAVNATPSGTTDYPEGGGTIVSRYSPCYNINTTDCRVNGMLENGINYHGNTFNCSVTGCVINKCSCGIEVGTQEVKVEGNNVYDSYMGISCSTSNVTISNNHIHDLRESTEMRSALALTGHGSSETERTVTITNNMLYNIPYYALVVYAGNRNIVLSGNSFKNIMTKPSSEYRFPFFFMGTNATPISNVTITNNVIQTDYIITGDSTIYLLIFMLRGCQNFVIDNNIITNLNNATIPRSYAFYQDPAFNNINIIGNNVIDLLPTKDSSNVVRSKGIVTYVEDKAINGILNDGLYFNYGRSDFPDFITLDTEGDYLEANVHLLLSSTDFIYIDATYNHGKIGNSTANAFYFKLVGITSGNTATVINYTNLTNAPHTIRIECASVAENSYSYNIYVDSVLGGTNTISSPFKFKQVGDTTSGKFILYSIKIKSGGVVLQNVMADILANGDDNVFLNYVEGTSLYDADLGKRVYFLNGLHEYDGATAGVKRNGATSERPASADIYVGFQYWDTSLGKMIAWDGTAWVNLDGTALS